MNPYYYVYIRIYKFLEGINQKKGAEWSALFAISVGISLNLGLIYVKVLNVTSASFNAFHKVPIVSFGLIIFLINCYLFIYKDKYKKIVSTYQNEKRRRKMIFGILILLYFMVTFALIIFF